jgi:hypothetical protein
MSGATARERIAIACVSLAVVLFEVLVTRVLSVTLAYHFAFLAVSLAMLGLGAPGVWLSLSPPGPLALRRALLASAAALPLSMLLVVHEGAHQRDATSFWVLCLLAPMLCLGAAVCLLLLRARGREVGAMYAADLAGAALGAALAVPLLHGLPTPSVIAALAALPLLALVALDPPARPAAAALALAVAAAVAWGAPFRLRYTRYYDEDRPLLYERWTPTARVTVNDHNVLESFSGWGMGTRWRRHDVDHLWIDQDGSAGTEILRHRAGAPYPDPLLYDVTSAAYQVGSPRRACIVGGGGGRDILTALAAGVPSVEVVELNPYIVDAVSRVFGAYSGDPYHLPGVTTFVGEGRSHLTRSATRCDVLQISLIDTFAASSAGAYALTENSLYTVEAMRTYWSRLGPDGVLSISRFSRGPGWVEAVRLVLLELETLRIEGVADPRRHLAVFDTGRVANTLLFRRPLDAARTAELSLVAERRGLTLVWPPPAGERSDAPIVAAIRDGGGAFEARGFDVSPPTDDRPFFFQTLNILRGSDAAAARGTAEREQSVSLLRRLLLGLTVLTLALFLLPFALRGRLPVGRGGWRATGFFAALGFGFMFVEIPLVQRLALYLGHPSYATTVALGSLLLGAGVGAALAPRIPQGRSSLALLLVPAVVAATTGPLTGPIARATAHWGLAARIAVTAALVFVAGLAMGVPFPLGMSRFDGRDRSWYWAINGAAGVLASVLALALALVAGLSNVLWTALACYVLAAVLYPRTETPG